MKRFLFLILAIFIFNATVFSWVHPPGTKYSSQNIDNWTYDEANDCVRVYVGSTAAITLNQDQVNQLRNIWITSGTITLTADQISQLRNIFVGSGTVTVSNYSSNTSTVTSYGIDYYTGKVSTGSAGLVSGGGITTVTITDTMDNWSFLFNGSSGTVRSSLWDGVLTLRNGADYSDRVYPPKANVTFIFETSDNATIDYLMKEIQ